MAGELLHFTVRRGELVLRLVQVARVHHGRVKVSQARLLLILKVLDLHAESLQLFF